jgi:acetyltransferase-like isoleucine patch superfamily enzyme
MPQTIAKLRSLIAACGLPQALWRATRAAGREFSWWLRRPLLRHALAALGPRSRVQGRVLIACPRQVSIGSDCLIARGTECVSESAEGWLRLGDRVVVNVGVHLDHTGGLTLEDGVLISEQAMLYTHDHGYDPRSRPKPCPLTLGAGAWIGVRAIVLPGVGRIGRGAIVGAGAVVTREVAAGSIVAGNPAREIGRRAGGGEERAAAGASGGDDSAPPAAAWKARSTGP